MGQANLCLFEMIYLTPQNYLQIPRQVILGDITGLYEKTVRQVQEVMKQHIVPAILDHDEMARGKSQGMFQMHSVSNFFFSIFWFDKQVDVAVRCHWWRQMAVKLWNQNLWSISSSTSSNSSNSSAWTTATSSKFSCNCSTTFVPFHWTIWCWDKSSVCGKPAWRSDIM